MGALISDLFSICHRGQLFILLALKAWCVRVLDTQRYIHMLLGCTHLEDDGDQSWQQLTVRHNIASPLVRLACNVLRLSLGSALPAD